MDVHINIYLCTLSLRTSTAKDFDNLIKWNCLINFPSIISVHK